MQNLEGIILEHPFFKEMDSRYISLIVGCASNVRLDKGEYLFREGGKADHFYLVRHGKIALELFSPGKGSLTIQTINQGDVLGWSWLFPPYRWHFDARVLELVRLVAFDGNCLRKKCEEDNVLGYWLMKGFARIMMQRLQATRHQLLEFSEYNLLVK